MIRAGHPFSYYSGCFTLSIADGRDGRSHEILKRYDANDIVFVRDMKRGVLRAEGCVQPMSLNCEEQNF